MARPKAPMELTNKQLEEIVDMYSEGASDVEAKAFIYDIRGSFSNDLWDRWLKEDKMFSETIKRGRLLSQRWWEQQGRGNLSEIRGAGNKTFNQSLWYMNMKNRFGWSNKTQTDITSKGERIPLLDYTEKSDSKNDDN